MPEHDLQLAEVIYQLYNQHLRCPGCERKNSADGSTFVRDTAGRNSSGQYYRKYTCKNKKKSSNSRPGDTQCSTTLSVKKFILVADQCLGPATVAELRTRLHLPFNPPAIPPRGPRMSSLPTPSPAIQVPSTPTFKRKSDGSKTGDTPASKRVNQQSTPRYEIKSLDFTELSRRVDSAEDKVRLGEDMVRRGLMEIQRAREEIGNVQRSISISCGMHL